MPNVVKLGKKGNAAFPDDMPARDIRLALRDKFGAKQPKIMVLGANGLCGTSLLPLLGNLFPATEIFGVDPCEEAKPPIIKAKVELPNLWHILRSFGMGEGDLLIDLSTDMDKIEVMKGADNVGVSVINATCCEADRGATAIIGMVDPRLLQARYEWNVPHLPTSGMNPGTINAMLAALVDKAGENPLDVTQWELDSTLPFEWDGEGFATWSPTEFASEFSDESTWEVDGKTIVFADGPPINNLRDLPLGMGRGALCQHEELIVWGWRYGCKARYLYGYSDEAMEAIIKSVHAGLDLVLCRKLEERTPTGGDTIGLVAEFPGGTMTASIRANNESDKVPIGSNATSYLVACGVAAGVEMLRSEHRSGVHWPDDYGPEWVDFLSQNSLCQIKID